MYKLHLIKKYLLKRRIAWVSLFAVMLCTAMVLIVISVMGGWLRMFKSSFRGMSGDIVVEGPSLVGFPYYQEMIDKIDALPDVVAAVPTIQSAGLINIGNRRRTMVEVVGIPTDQIDRVGNFSQSLYLQHDNLEGRKQELQALAKDPRWSDEQRQELLAATTQPVPNFNLLPDVRYELIAGRKARNPRQRPGMIVSDAIATLEKGDVPGKWLYEYNVTLTMVPILPGEQVKAEDAVTVPFWIVDSCHPQIWQIDANRVYVPFEELQRDLRMSGVQGEPSRASQIQIKAKPDVDLLNLRDRIDVIVRQVQGEHDVGPEFPSAVYTWQQIQGEFIDAVEHEVVLTTILFGIVSVVAVFLIFCIFYMIVMEKTKDIGIIKSVGATSWGVAQIFLGYGLAIGVVGAGMGLLLAFLIVHYINELHAELAKIMGVPIWDPKTYQFDKIPNTMEWHTVGWIMAVAILSALLGALLPAIRAAGMNPVEALRYE